MGKGQLNQLEAHGAYLSVPHGISMWPMIRDRKDVVEIAKLDRKPKRYDLVMYTRGNAMQGVIHRVLYWRNGVCVICGDNCWQKEYVKPEQIAGIAMKFYRNGKCYSVTNRWYLLYVHLWTDLFFIRRPLFYCRDGFKRLIAKIRKH